MLSFFRPRIRHPLYPSLRAAPAGSISALGHPKAVSGTFQELARAALYRVAPRRAVFVLQREGEPLLTDAQRDELWEKFRVPAYVLLLDSQRKVCAYECEAHQGLHLPRNTGGRRIPQGIETTPCGCGRPGPRLPYRRATLAAAG